MPAASASCSGVFTGAAAGISSIDSLSLRVDQSIGKNAWLFVRYANVPSTAVINSVNPGESDITDVSGHLWTLGSTITLKPNLVDELRFNYTVSSTSLTQTLVPYEGSSPYPKDLLFPSQYITGAGTYGGFAGFFLPNMASIAAPVYSTQYHQCQYNLIDSVSLTLGNHALKFGGDYRKLLPSYAPSTYGASYYFESPQGVQQGFADVAVITDALAVRPSDACEFASDCTSA
jgi:hypothetical protein